MKEPIYNVQMGYDDSDEVKVVVKDSERDGRRYWNLREAPEAYNSYASSYGRETENLAGSRDGTEGIQIDFRMNEFRDLSDRQRRQILETLIDEEETIMQKNQGLSTGTEGAGGHERGVKPGDEGEGTNRNHEAGHGGSNGRSNSLLSDRFIPLVALMAFLTGLVVMFLIAGSRTCYY